MRLFSEDIQSRAIFENLPYTVSKCTRECVINYDGMYLNKDEEFCIKNCYLKTFEFQTYLN